MAEPNWDAYAKSFAGYGSPEAQMGSSVGAGIGAGLAAIPRIEEKLNTSAQEALDMSFRPLMDYVSLPVEQWADIDMIGGMSGIPSAGSAYLKWKQSLSPRHQRIARRKGLLNPIAFKQMYDAQMEMVLPEIKNKLNSYKTMNNKTDSDMKKLFKDKKNLNAFLLQNTSAEELATTSGYLAPDQTWAQWWDKKGTLGKAATVAGPPLTAAYGVSVAKDIGKRGFGGRYNPMGKKKALTLTDKGKAAAIKELGWKGKTTALDKKAMKSARSAQSKATRAFNKAELKFNLNNIDKSLDKMTKNIDSGKNIGKGVPSLGKDFEKVSTKGRKLKKAQEAAKLKNIAVKKGAAEGPTRVVTAYVKKHGVSGLMKKVIKKAGWKGAANLLGKGALSLGLKGTGVGALASLALDAATIYSIYSMITSED